MVSFNPLSAVTSAISSAASAVGGAVSQLSGAVGGADDAIQALVKGDLSAFGRLTASFAADFAALPVKSEEAQQALANRQIDSIFNNPNLSIEDKVMLLLFAIMDKMDQDITKKGKEVAKAKSDATNSDTGGGENTAPKDSAANGTSSLDQQTFELQQLTTRRNNLFSMMNAIVSKFDDSTAKVLQKLGQS